MKTNLSTLFVDLMYLCDKNEAFYFVDQTGPDGNNYRIFTYRLASYTDFQNHNAIECRGHTFRNDNGTWVLASLPPQKFFNYAEHQGWGTEIDLSTMSAVMVKMDGSLISTVVGQNGEWFLKSKTSFTSQQAVEATEWLKLTANADFYADIAEAVQDGYTVNAEYVSPTNQIVIGYSQPNLVVLNARHIETGEYMSRNELVDRFGEMHVVESLPTPNDAAAFIRQADDVTGIEGYVICFENGLWVKVKTAAYSLLHKTKEQVSSDAKLWAACVSELADDLRALFINDPIVVARIISMEERAAKIYNHAHKVINAFYEANKHLSRKEYAILGQQELNADGLFSLAMNLYIGKPCDIKSHLIKNYKNYGISDNVTEPE